MLRPDPEPGRDPAGALPPNDVSRSPGPVDLEPGAPAEPEPASATGAARPAEPAASLEPLPDGSGDARPVVPVAARGRVAPVHLALAVVALLAGAALFLSGYSLGARIATTPGTPAGQDAAFAPFWDAYDAISHLYVGKADQKAVVEGAIRGMFESLGDPYSAYLSPDDFKRTLQDVAGQFEGIGAQIGTKKPDGTTTDCAKLASDCQMVVVEPLAGSPAEKAGLKAGDRVVAIDGQTVDGLTLDQATGKVRGPKGTTVKLTIERAGQRLDLSIVRDVITQKEVVSKSLAGGTVGYLKLTGFSPTSATDFVGALNADVKGGQKKIVVDLRGNPGGYVNAARQIASQFIGSGPLFWQEDAKGTQTATDALPAGVATDPSIKVVVLIDKGSASASEILAGALQDTHRATLVGDHSFGKGTVQEWITLPDDAGGFRLSVAKWLTPDKHWVHPDGLTPDVAVTVPANTPAGSDPVLDRALQVLGAAPASVGA